MRDGVGNHRAPSSGYRKIILEILALRGYPFRQKIVIGFKVDGWKKSFLRSDRRPWNRVLHSGIVKSQQADRFTARENIMLKRNFWKKVV